MAYLMEGRQHLVLPNVSPIMQLHSLLVPYWRDGLSQRLSSKAVKAAFQALCCRWRGVDSRSSYTGARLGCAAKPTATA